MTTKTQLALDAAKCGVPEHLIEGLVDYAFDRVPTGGFLYAVLSNNLMDAVARCDEDGTARLFSICKFIYNYVPSACHGSPGQVLAWVEGMA